MSRERQKDGTIRSREPRIQRHRSSFMYEGATVFEDKER